MPRRAAGLSGGMVVATCPRLGARASFAASLGVLAVVLGGSAVASPLYDVYQRSWHFSSIALTAVFAVYAIALLAVLLVAGRLSDYLGRRPIMATALLFEAAAALAFLAAHGLGALFVARSLQGVATALGVGAAGAALLEQSPADRPGLGATVNSSGTSAALGLAALGAGAVIQYGPAPTHLVFWLLFAASVLGVLVLFGMPEPGVRSPLHASVLRPTVGVPRAARTDFAVALPALVSTWALGGLYFSLGPGLIGQLAGSRDVVWGGLAIFALSASGAAAPAVVGRRTPRTAMTGGSAVLAVGAAATLAAIVGHSAVGFLLATAFTGIGFGTSFLGAFRHLTALALPHERGALVSTLYVVAYLAFSLPVIVAGVLTTHLGLHATAIGYAGVVSGLAVLAAVAGMITGGGRRRAAAVAAQEPYVMVSR